MWKTTLKILAGAGVVLGVLVGFETLGFAFTPWETRTHASEIYEKLELDQRVLLLDIRVRLERIENCLITKSCGILNQEDY